MSKTYQHIEVSDADLATITANYPASTKKINELVNYWAKAHARGVRRTQHNFGSCPEGVWIGRWHRRLDNLDIEVITALLRHMHCNTRKMFSQYQLNFIHGLEDIAHNEKKRNVKQGWLLAMLILEKVVE